MRSARGAFWLLAGLVTTSVRLTWLPVQLAAIGLGSFAGTRFFDWTS